MKTYPTFGGLLSRFFPEGLPGFLLGQLGTTGRAAGARLGWIFDIFIHHWLVFGLDLTLSLYFPELDHTDDLYHQSLYLDFSD